MGSRKLSCWLLLTSGKFREVLLMVARRMQVSDDWATTPNSRKHGKETLTSSELIAYAEVFSALPVFRLQKEN